MKDTIQQLLEQAATSLGIEMPRGAKLESTRDPSHGDLASNLALVSAKQLGKPPRDIAQALIDALPEHPAVRKAEIAGPGFINVFLANDRYHAMLRDIVGQAEQWGYAPAKSRQKVLLEFVSANPTGPLHVGHGRGAAYGDCLVRLLRAAGDDVQAEYYVNDAGRQMDILALSVWLRLIEQQGHHIEFPARAYQGQYVHESAQRLADQNPTLQSPDSNLFLDLPADDDENGDTRLDTLIQRAKNTLGAASFDLVQKHALNEQLSGIADDLIAFRVPFGSWASERSVVDKGEVKKALDQLTTAGFTFEKEGALWFASSRFGDDKDRVLLRANGAATYFANDIAYHLDKLERGYDRLIDVWGADHHGYVKRMSAAVEALTGQSNKLDVQLVQFVSLLRDGEKVSMSTRAGTYETLQDLRDEVGVDAARYFYVMRSNDQHLEFDLALATQKSNDNPVYYVQYAHARIASVMRQLKDKQFSFDAETAATQLDKLDSELEREILKLLARFPEMLNAAAQQLAPQLMVHYLRELAEHYHRYYNSSVFLLDQEDVRNARLYLNLAVRQVLRNGLALLGVEAPDEM
ncbi:MAG: arginine--tRNA ligase [Oceanococcus sp.]